MNTARITAKTERCTLPPCPDAAPNLYATIALRTLAETLRAASATNAEGKLA